MSNLNKKSNIPQTYEELKKLCNSQDFTFEEFTFWCKNLTITQDEIYNLTMFLLQNKKMKQAKIVMENNFTKMGDKQLGSILGYLYNHDDITTETLKHEFCKRILFSQSLNVNFSDGLQLMVAAKENLIDWMKLLLEIPLMHIYARPVIIDSWTIMVPYAPLYVAWKNCNYKIAKMIIKKIMETTKDYSIDQCKINIKIVSSKEIPTSIIYNNFLDGMQKIIDDEKLVK